MIIEGDNQSKYQIIIIIYLYKKQTNDKYNDFPSINRYTFLIFEKKKNAEDLDKYLYRLEQEKKAIDLYNNSTALATASFFFLLRATF